MVGARGLQISKWDPTLAFGRDAFFRATKKLQELPHEEWKVLPSSRGDQISLHHHFCILELTPSPLDIRGQGFVGGDGAAPESIHASEYKRAVAERGDRFLTFHKIPYNLL